MGLVTARRHVAATARPSTEVVPLRPPRAAPVPGEVEVARRGDVDEWGRSERVRALARRLYDPVYTRWFRAEWGGLEKIPAEGGALLVANHGGALPSDAPVLMHGIEKELGRPVYGMAHYFFRTVPVVGTLWSRAGGVPAHPDNAYRLLPVTANVVAMGPLGAVVPFPAKFRMKVLDPVAFDVPPDQARYSKSRVMEESERIRDRLQATLYEMLGDRRSIWSG